MTDNRILDRVRKLLAKAEAEGCTPEEAEALTEKAELGFYEKRAGSNIWYRPGDDKNTYAPRICETCGNAFMGLRRGQKHCSNTCKSHAQRQPDAEYFSLHGRVYHARGKARDQTCVDCGNPADDWSTVKGTDGTDPIKHYEPRCRSCHRLYDQNTQGEANGRANLTEARVRGIYLSAGATDAELADRHGTDKSNVNKIRRGAAWKHITKGRKATW